MTSSQNGILNEMECDCVYCEFVLINSYFYKVKITENVLKEKFKISRYLLV